MAEGIPSPRPRAPQGWVASRPSRLDSLVVRYAECVLRYRWWVILLSVLAVAAMGVGIRRVVFDTDYRVFFSRDNPQLLAFEAVQDIYTKNDNILFVVVPEEGDVFTRGALAAVEELTAKAWRIPYSTRVDSVTNFQHSYAEGDELVVRDLVKDALSQPADAREAARRAALAEPALRGRLIRPDTRVTGVNVTLELPRTSRAEVVEATAFARRLAAEVEADHPGTAVRLTGIVPLNNAFVEASIGDITTLVPVMFGVLAVMMLVILRSPAGTLAILAVIALSVVAAEGFAGWAGIRITPPSADAPIIILTLAVADSVHFLTTLFREMRAGASRFAGIVESLRVNFAPIFLTSLTTAIGFLTLNFSDAPPFRDLGNITAFGVTVAYLLSVLFLPALVAVVPLRARRALEGRKAMERLAAFVVARRTPLLWGMAALILGLGAFIPRIELNDQFVRYFDRDIEFRRDTDFTIANLTGIYQLEYSLPAGGTGAVAEPLYLRDLESLAGWFRAQPEVLHVSVLSDTMKRLNRNMHGDDPDRHRLPETRRLAAQYLLLYELSLPFGLDLNNQINVDKSATRFVATVGETTTAGLRALEARADAWMRENLPADRYAPATGAPLIFAYISKRNIESMLLGTPVALVLISVILIGAFRSLRIGLVSLLPNLVPAAMSFGLWGMTVGRVDMAVSVIAAISLGIVVDDTIHYLSKYLRARRERGLAPEAAVRHAFVTVGTALAATTAILIAGFLVLATSNFAVNAKLGLLTAFAIAFGLLADFLFLPPLLLKIEETTRARTETVPAA